MLAEADLVLTGRVVDAIPADRIDPFGNQDVRTLFKIKPDEVFRNVSPRTLDELIDVVRAVGERDRGSYIQRVEQEGFPTFNKDRKYLLFLVSNSAVGAWVPAFGPDSFFDLTNGVALAAGTSKVIASLRGKSAEQVLQTVRRGGV
jgi:hypothetical protein